MEQRMVAVPSDWKIERQKESISSPKTCVSIFRNLSLMDILDEQWRVYQTCFGLTGSSHHRTFSRYVAFGVPYSNDRWAAQIHENIWNPNYPQKTKHHFICSERHKTKLHFQFFPAELYIIIYDQLWKSFKHVQSNFIRIQTNQNQNKLYQSYSRLVEPPGSEWRRTRWPPLCRGRRRGRHQRGLPGQGGRGGCGGRR